MAGLLSGLARFGLGDLEKEEVFSKEEKQNKDVKEKPPAPVLSEADFLFDRSYVCPVCGSTVSAKTIRSGKVKLKKTDPDLRPRYDHVDLLKYDIVACNVCGYAALAKSFEFLGPKQIELLETKMKASFKPQEEKQTDVYSYDDALERYKLALASSIVKRGKTSERAYLCLKVAWLLRGKREAIAPTVADYKKVTSEIEQQENEFLKAALEGFLAARGSESFPMCGMDELTVDYLISAIAVHFNQYDLAKQLLSRILTSNVANKRLKDRAVDLKNSMKETQGTGK